MTEDSTALRIETAAVSDRGLNERRPLNEDSMLNDPSLSIFAVADGVGGAEAGEVASQTAVEVLQEAFRQHQRGDDIEDLMEIAIQRANDSIYKQAREDPRLQMMATTIVALHLEGRRATIGHVGDSRLYRLHPDGRLARETEDHSLVEEEVRAGRMTAQQAANHPSRNVISRALGAEPSVEVDMKTFEVDDGTLFLLCSDGITRHIPDEELSTLLRTTPDLEQLCGEMKRLCYERGAEDNLTAVLVRVGGAGGARHDDSDEEATIIRERAPHEAAMARTLSDEPVAASVLLQRPFHDARGAPAAEIARAPSAASQYEKASAAENGTSKHSPEARRGGGAGRVLGVLLLLAAVGAAAFFAGRFYGAGREAVTNRGVGFETPSATPAAVLAAPEDAAQRFERLRRAVDLSPAAEAERMAAEFGGQPLNSSDPEFLYLYGRAMLLIGRNEEAGAAFDRAIQRAGENMTSRNAQLKFDARLAHVTSQLRSGKVEEARAAADALAEYVRASDGGAAGNTQPSPGVSP
jgi:serine/threonine protein phosphatase PrpC